MFDHATGNGAYVPGISDNLSNKYFWIEKRFPYILRLYLLSVELDESAFGRFERIYDENSEKMHENSKNERKTMFRTRKCAYRPKTALQAGKFESMSEMASYALDNDGSHRRIDNQLSNRRNLLLQFSLGKPLEHEREHLLVPIVKSKIIVSVASWH